MYDYVHDISARPTPFSRYTAKALWTRQHLSRQMLKYHLDQETDLASRRFEMIESTVEWIDSELTLSGKNICDLGCGPGLYTERFSALGATVTGVDFSENSLSYARKNSEHSVCYIHADYLEDELPSGFDAITLIYTDLCVLSPDQRARLLGKMREMLNPSGTIVIDVAGVGLLGGKQEVTLIEDKLMGGFWSEGDYVGIQKSFVYEDLHLSLDRYVIIEPNEIWQIYNWFQHYTPQMIEKELSDAGFSVVKITSDLTGAPINSNGEYIGVIASKS
ncbi:MAG: class I SAM-dependent methyltransferase [Candidatus Thiodiazotropha sp. (ex Lucinoma borealis)]|nr:class I SAM-dependent methyltransferase [Candidatus Thiodiazotropha sp. (ex Lucinoma borealis)]